MIGVPYAYGKDRHLSINLFVKKFEPKNEIRTKMLIEVIVMLLSVFIMIIGGIQVTLNSAGQISPAMQIPMQIYYVCVPICGILMVIYSMNRMLNLVKELKEGQ